MSTLPKEIYRFNIIPFKIAMMAFCRNRKKIHLKIHMESQGIPSGQNNLKKVTS
jgi:hypothetical protein